MNGQNSVQETPAASLDLPTPELLLSAAADLMMERDTIDISLNDIARKSGLNSALVKYYFGNKSGMLLAMVRRAVGASLAHLQEVVDMPIAAEDKLRLHIRGVVSSHHRHPYLHRLLHYMLSQENETFAATLSRELINPVTSAQRRILEEGAAAGVFKSVDPVMFYFHLLGACESLFYSRSMLMSAFGIKGITKDFKQAYVEYLCDAVMTGMMVRPMDARTPVRAIPRE
jgi:AcrR family transcriptional regulator